VDSAVVGSRCSSCGQQAPVELSGLEARCSACGARRFPLSAPSVSLTGQPARFGGSAATLFGVAVLVLGGALSIGVLLLLQSIAPTTALGWAVGIPMLVASAFFGILLLVAGNRLKKHGSAKARAVRFDALRALIAHKKRPVTPHEVARALNLSDREADALLTEFVSEYPTPVTLDVGDDGQLRYDFSGSETRWRVLEEEHGAELDRELGDEASKQRFRVR
jgi:hypothetical protein